MTRRAPHRSVRTPTGTWNSVYVQKYAVWIVPAVV